MTLQRNNAITILIILVLLSYSSTVHAELTNSQAADVVIGQPDFTSGSANQGGSIAANTLSDCCNVFSDGKRLFVSDSINNRVLIYNSIPSSNNASADVVVGQSNFTSAEDATTANRFHWYYGNAISDGKRLFVADIYNYRVLIFNSIPTSNNASADVVVGNSNFTSVTAGVTSNRLNRPYVVFSDGKRLFIGDAGNHRVLVFNSIPTTNNASAEAVIGQPNFTSNTANNGGIGANTLSLPRGISSDGKRLFVSDMGNRRVLIYNIASGSPEKLGPQFEQGKALVGKVFNDINANGIQDNPTNPTNAITEPGIEGVKVVSDTGIYAITDSDGKYHFPYIEVGQHLLKIDESTLPEGSTITTDNPYHVTVTEGVLTKVSFGVSLPKVEGTVPTSQRPLPGGQSLNEPLLKVSVSQDPVMLKPRLSISHKIIQDKGTVPTSGKAPTWGTVPSDESIEFTITCNYYLFIAKSNIKLYDKDYNLIKTIDLPNPIPSNYSLPLNAITLKPNNATNAINAITLQRNNALLSTLRLRQEQ